MLKIAEIRKLFLDYFIQNGHTHIPASPLIPHNDPSLMFVNSGMVQFKNVFTGLESRDYTKAVTSQKCIRAGGKHNDLDNVGYTARHHTFFEMLGNFSFGDYFKEEAIYHAWQLLTKEFGINKSKLYATIYHTDIEAENYWRKIAGFDSNRIIKINTTDNFWSMGDTGPCGPCSEIFYDHGDQVPGGLPGTINQDGDRYIEIWNMVFMQFEQIDKDTRVDLPKKSIDTGMGLERIAAVLQNVHDNYEIDLFREIIDYTKYLLNIQSTTQETKTSLRVIADHIRSCTFLIADGVTPLNEGRGYVLRRIMRRAMRHAHLLGAKEPLLYKLLPKVIDLMSDSYPELKRAQDFASDILREEELRFKVTLEQGLGILNNAISRDDRCNKDNSGFGDCSVAGNKILPGDVAFKLYDTYGFPLDLTEDILKAYGMTVDIAGFDRYMQEQKERSKNAWGGSGEDKVDNIWFNIKEQYGFTKFLGYDTDFDDNCQIILLLRENLESILPVVAETGSKFYLVADQTPFYGESGGQLGDIGIISSPNFKIKVIDTIKYLGGIIVHSCILEEGEVRSGEKAKFKIDTQYRNNLRIHHSATHILHAALHEIIGKHVTQKGSLVAHNRLRFDINHQKALSKLELDKIEDRVNEIIRANFDVKTGIMPTEQAMQGGAMALFGEKYDSMVRVVSFCANSKEATPYSIELCGGTHVNRTGDIGILKIISENAIAAGIRRIEAVAGSFALDVIKQNENIVLEIANIVKSAKNDLVEKINHVYSTNKELTGELESLRITNLVMSNDEILRNSKMAADTKLLYKVVKNIDVKLIRQAVDVMINNCENLVVVYVCTCGNKISVIVGVSKNIVGKFAANDIAKAISTFLGWSGAGGSTHIAQAGGGDGSKLPDLEDKMIKILQ